jgi:hypothetical protein
MYHKHHADTWSNMEEIRYQTFVETQQIFLSTNAIVAMVTNKNNKKLLELLTSWGSHPSINSL